MSPSVSESRPFPMMLLLFIIALVFFGWAAWFEIDQSVRATGQIIPTSHTQIIQAADGGVLSRILVREGERVQSGQEVAVLEKDRPNAVYEEIRAKHASISAALVRAKAEAHDQSPDFSNISKEFQRFVMVQKKIHEQRKRTLHDELKTLDDALTLAQEELRMHDRLFKTGDISRLEVMNARRKVNELQGKIQTERNKYRQEARQDAARLEEELSMSSYKLEEKKDVLEHTVLKAPVAGIVKYLRVTTIGGVLRAGDELMQISPTEDDMVVEIKVNPVDIGQLHPGLTATIKLDAFDYSIFGALSGALTYISSDTLTEQDGLGQSRMYYRASVRIDPQRINVKLAQVPLKPGMTASVDIRTDSRSVLQYLLKPLFKAFSGALIER